MMMREELLQFESQLQALDLSRARETLQLFSPQNNTEQRIQKHLQAKVLIYEHRFAEAKIILENAIREHGSNIGVLCDLSLCNQMLGHIHLWNEQITEIENIFERYIQLMSPEDCIRNYNFLAKAREEQGSVHTALKYIEHSLRLCKSNSLNDGGYLQTYTLTQLLRITSCYFPLTRIEPMYRELLAVQDCSTYLQIEIEHALMIAELQIFGPDIAKIRLTNNLQKNILDGDRRLFYFDYLESLLRLGFRDLEISKLPSTQLWEKAIKDLYFSPEKYWSAQELHQIFTESSPICSLRFFHLLANTSLHMDLREMADKFIRLHLRAFNDNDRSVWLQSFGIRKKSALMTLQLNEQTGHIFCEKLSVSLQRKGNLLELARLFASSPYWPVQSLISKLWTENFDSSYFHRLRMQVNRLNTALEPLTGLQKTLRISTREVSLNENVQIKIVCN